MTHAATARSFILAALLAAAAAAQTPEKSNQPEKPAIPSLDELLGLGESESPADLDPAARELDEKLAGDSPRHRFARAVLLMDHTAQRIHDAHDTGLVTQRLQEEILRNLDALIRDAQQQQQQQSSSRQQQQQQQQRQPDQQQQRNDQNQGENQDERSPPARQDGPLNPEVAGAGAQWGFLPERVRDSLRQGSTDAFSSIYRSITEAYYRRIAEEASRR